MFPPARSRFGAIAVASVIPLSACTQATLGISPESILATVIASIPSSIPTTTGGSSSRGRRRIPVNPSRSTSARSVRATS